MTGDFSNPQPRSQPAHDRAIRSRRDFLLRCGAGFGALPLVALSSEGRRRTPTRRWRRRCRQTHRSAARGPMFAPRAKSVIFLFMDGGPSQLDTFDPKPAGQRAGGPAAAVEHQAPDHADGRVEQCA